jgi:hypothetical protein
MGDLAGAFTDDDDDDMRSESEDRGFLADSVSFSEDANREDRLVEGFRTGAVARGNEASDENDDLDAERDGKWAK